MNPVNDRPFLPQAVPPDFHGLLRTFGELVRQLLAVFSEYGFRINHSLPKDGSERMDAPLPLKTYLTAARPDPADWPGAVIYVSDASAGQKFQGSDGSAWVPLG